MKKDNVITEFDVDIFFIKIFALFLICFAIIIEWIYFLEKSEINLAKNNIYAYCNIIYKDFGAHWNFIEFIDHCMEKNK